LTPDTSEENSAPTPLNAVGYKSDDFLLACSPTQRALMKDLHGRGKNLI
jgi:hypothetical protein